MKLSIIIPVYNGKIFIESFANAINKQTVKNDNYELIIIDNGSTDASIIILEKYFKKLNNVIILPYINKQSSYAARNYGVSRANGNILAFTDIDCIPSDNWIESIFNHSHLIQSNFLISGKIKLFPKKKYFNVFEMYDNLVSLDQAKYAKKKMGTTANLMISKENFNYIGKFKNVISGGDGEFCNRATLAGIKFKYIDKIIIYHPARSSLKSLIIKAKRIGKGWAELQCLNTNIIKKILLILKTLISVLLPKNSFKLVKKVINSSCSNSKDLINIGCLIVVIYYIGTIERISKIRGLTQCIEKKH